MNKGEARYRDKINFITEKIESVPAGNLEDDKIVEEVIKDHNFE